MWHGSRRSREFHRNGVATGVKRGEHIFDLAAYTENRDPAMDAVTKAVDGKKCADSK